MCILQTVHLQQYKVNDKNRIDREIVWIAGGNYPPPLSSIWDAVLPS